MARMSFSERYKQRKEGKEEEVKASSSSEKKTSSTKEKGKTFSERYNAQKLERSIGLDTLETDLASISETISKIYGGWQDADTMKNTKGSVSTMYDRLNNYKTYVNSTSSDDLTDFNKSMDELLSGYKSTLDQWDNVASTYSQFVTPDAYNSAKKNHELSEKYKDLDYAGVQEAKLNSEDADWLSEYGVNVGYSSLKDYNTELHDLSNKIASLQGEEKKKAQAYYDKLKAKANQYALDNAFEKYSYLMSNEDFEEKSTVSDADYSLWDMFTAKSDELDYMYINDEDMRKKIDTASRLIGGNSGPFSAMSEQAKDGLKSMTEEEKKVYTYIYNTQGAEAARAYKEDMEVTWSKRESDAAEQQMSEFANKNAFNATVASALSVPLSIIGGTSSFIENSLGKLTGKEINPYNYAAQVQNASTATREKVGGNIAENTDWEIGGVNIAKFAYDTGLSVAESALGAATFGKGFTAIMGMSSASQKAKELKDAGATEEQIVAGSVASGLAEAVFEKFSIDNLLKPKSAETLLGMVRETAKQMGIEASEEMFTEIANTVSDTLIRQNTSDLAKSYEDYLYRGYTEKEAKKLVGKDVASNVMWSGIGGALSGGVMGGVSSGANLAGNASLGSTIRENNNVSDLRDITSGLNNDAYTKYLELIDSGKIKDGQLGGLYGKVSEEVDTNYQAEKKNADLHAIANRATEFGESKNAGIIATAVQKKLNNQTLSSEERTALESDTAKAIMQEIERGEITTKRTGSFKEAYDTRTKMQSVLTTPKSEETVRVQKRVAEMNTGAETVDNESGQKIEIEGMGKDEEGNTVLQTSEGTRLLSDITLSDHAAEVVATAEGMDDTKADTFVSLYKEGMDVEEYKTSFELAFSYGQNGFGTENVLKNKGILTEEQAASAYEAGMKFATEARQKHIDEVTAKHFSGVTPGNFDDSKVDYSKINSRQKAAIEVTKLWSKATGINVSYFQSEADASGHREAENGSFDPSTNTIYIDVYAGVTENVAKDSIINTVSHETSHWIKDKAPTEYNKISGIVLDTLAREFGVTPDVLIKAEVARYKKEYGKEVSEEYAKDELIARATEDMLSGNRSVQELISQMDEKTAKTFSERLKIAFEKIKEWLADLLGSYKSNSEEAKIIRKYADKVNELQEAWDEAFDKAIKTNQVMRTSKETMPMAASERTQFSEREKIGGGLLSKSEFAQFYERLSDKKNGAKFPKDREGNFIFTIGNKLVYNNGRYISPKISKIVTVNVAEDSDSEITYTSFVQEDIIRYETDRHFEGTSFEEFSEYEQRAFLKGFGREVHIESNYGYDSGRNAGNGLGSKKQVRSNIRINFENEQNGSRSDSESRGSESESVMQYSERDSEGNGLTKEQIEFFKNSKAVDEEGNLMVVYHGTVREFYTFDKSYANPEGNMGSGFYFTSDVHDVERNYANFDGADFVNKLQKEAEMLEWPNSHDYVNEDGSYMDVDEIVEVLREKYATAEEPITLETYLNIQNPCYVGDHETYLMSDISDEYNMDDFEDEDDYYAEVEQMAQNYIDDIMSAIDNEGYYNTDDIPSILYDAYSEGGITLEGLKDRLNELYIEDENGAFVANEVARIIVEQLGYDGIIDSTVADKFKNMGMNQGTIHYIVFNSNQAKLTSNKKPTTNEDIRYSERDSEGNGLTKDQIEYFKNSKVRDENGNLKVMYHGTENASFTVFNPEYSDDGISMFFTDSKTVAKGYSGTTEEYIVGKKYTIADLTNIINNSYYYVTEEDGKYHIIYNNYGKLEKEYTTDTLAEMQDYVLEEYGSTGAGNYKVYLNIENPLVVEGDNNYWDELPAIDGVENTTRGYAEYAKSHGYDGVIFNNIIDTAIYASSKERFEPAMVVVAFDANQIKSVANENPSDDADIRYSNRDSNGNGLTKEQVEYFKESKVRDAEGNLKLMYHGTADDFTIFNPFLKGGKNGTAEGYGLYFADNSEVSNAYGGKLMSGYLNITRPATSYEKTIKNNDLVKLIKATCEEQAKRMVDDGDYDNIKDALKDTWISDYVYTYDISINEAYKQVADSILSMNSDDMNIVQEVMAGNAIRDYKSAYEFYDILRDTLGIDGFITTWEDSNTGETSQIAVAFDSNQFKNIDNVNPTSDPDIRYSERNNESIYDAVGELKRLQKENEKLKKDVERLRQRNKLERTVTGGTVLNENQIASVASYILNNADSTYSRDQLTEELKDIYKYLQSEDVTWDILMLKATDVAQRIVAGKRERTIPNDYAKEILYTLRNTKVSLNETQKAEAKYAYGKDWYKMYFGRVLVTNDGIPLDSMWQEWAQMYPDVFDADMSDADMATEVLNAYDAVKASSEIVEAYDRAEMEREIAVEIYNQFWNVSPVRTLADKYEREIANLKHEKNKALYEKKLAAAQKYDQAIKQLKYEHRVEMKDMKAQYNQRKTEAVYKTKERYQNTIKEMRTKRAEEIRQIREKNKEYNQAYRDRLMRKAEIDKITKKALKLNTWLVKNSKEAHVPEILKKPVAAVLKSLNFSSERLLGLYGGEQAGTPTKKDISLSKAFEDLADMVGSVNDAQINDKELDGMYGHLDLPADFVDFVRSTSASINDLLRAVGDNEYILNELTLDQLKDINNILSVLSHTVTQTNKALAASHGKSIAALAQDTMIYANDQGKHSKMVGGLTDFFNFSNALPYYAFKRFGEGGRRIFEAFQDGWDKFAFNVKEIMDYSDNTYTAKEVKEWQEQVHEFDVLNGKEEVHVKMTTAQIMSLYCLQKREQAKGHLIGGGIRVADFQEGRGKVTQPDGVTLQEKDINNIISKLTDRQLDVADRLQEFMNTVCTDWGNEVSMIRFGYKAFGEENYFPISSDTNNLAQDDAKEQQNSLFRLLNMSFTKGTINNANNRVVIDNIFDVFASHTSDMAKYNALALPVLDAFKWYNYKEKIKVNPADKDDRRFKTKGVKQSVEKAYGAGAKKYIVQFLRDINGANSGGIEGAEQLAKKLMANYKVASVGANLRVALLQPSSYIRASVLMDAKYLTKAFTKKPQIEKARETCGIALWKSLGFYDTNIAKGVAEQIKHDDSVMDKIKESSMKLAEWGDSITWGYLYNACEAEVKDKQPGLTGKAKEEAIAKRLREVIYATQVVDSTMTRTQMMRNKSTWIQMATSFMSEPMISYNLLHDCFMQYNTDKRITGSKGTALKRNGKKISRAMMAYTLTTFASALAGALPDALRDDDEEKEFAETFISNAAENAVSDALGMIPLFKDVVSLAQGYDVARMDTQALASIVRAYQSVAKAVEEGEVTYKTIYNAVRAISQATGIPLSNLMRDAVAIWNSTIGESYDSVKLK